MNVQDITGLEEHPVLRQIPDILQGEEREAAINVRKQILINEVLDPLRNGFELDIWKLADDWRSKKRLQYPKGVIWEIDLGGNRSGKTMRASKRVVEDCVANPGHIWWCCDATETQSRANQQRYIFKHLPYEWKPGETGRLTKKNSRVTKVTYSVAGGFTENNLILPNGSEIHFKFYEMNVANLPGVELDGIWADELIPLPWIETLVYRLTNRNGIFNITFTPEQGYTPTVAKFLDGATTLQWADAKLCPHFNEAGDLCGYERIPKVQQPLDDKAIVIYFYNEDNPFGNYEGLKMDLKGKSKAEVLMRAYGIVSKAAHAQFPSFSEEIHVVDPDKIPKQGTNFHVVDPADGRNWFMIWVRIDEKGRWWIYREWPSHGHLGAYVPGIGDPGPWAIHGAAADGERGPAQSPFGFGLDRYKNEIERLEKEGGDETVERWMDSRYGASPTTIEEGTTTLIEKMSEIGMDFLAASGKMISEGVDLIADKLDYDRDVKIGEFSARLARLNEPRLYVSRNCPNMIFAFKNWTGKDKNHGACKDGIDCARYAVLAGIDYIGEDSYTWKRF
jgi:phage terminase large subunit-like protein